MAGEIRLTRKQLMLFKLETTYAADAAPNEASSGQPVHLMEPFETDMTQEFVERNPANNTTGFDRPIPTVRPIGVTFRSFVTGHTVGDSYTAAKKPPLADLFRACGMQETFVASNANGDSEYSYQFASSVASHHSATIVAHHDGYDQRLLGARGNVNFIYAAAAPVIAEFTFRGLLSTEAETTRGTATFNDPIPPRWIDSGSVLFAQSGYCLDIENLNLNTNWNLFEQRASCALSGSGILGILLTERTPGGSMDPYATRTSTADLIGQWRSGSGATLVLNTGLDDGNRFSITASQMVHKTMAWADKSGAQIFNDGFQLYQFGAGNNELRISFTS